MVAGASTVDERPVASVAPAVDLERRGRRWLLWSFVLCPCHLPLTLAVVAGLLGGTALGAALADHVWLAGAVIAATWAAGTARGFQLIRRADRGELTCALPRTTGTGRRRPER